MFDIDRSCNIPIVALDLTPDTVSETLLDVVAGDLVELLKELDPALVVVDLSATQYLTSKAVSILVQAWRTMKLRKGRIGFCGINAYSRKVLRTLQLDQHWELYSSRAEAVESLTPRKPRSQPVAPPLPSSSAEAPSGLPTSKTSSG